MAVTQTIFVTIRSRPSQLTFALVIRRTGAVPVNAFFETSALAKSLAVANVALLASAYVRTGRIQTGGIRVAIVLA